MSKELFKSFARNHPELASSVMDNKTTWQKLYELYEMYGDNSSVWNKYFNNSVNTTNKESTFSEIFNMIKNVDLDSVQKGVNSLQKTIGLLQDIGIGTATKNKVYEPRPMYKYFDD